ncbi:MAG: hypothetical protein FJY85_01905 [Deltaproteobacteria bacterium]|nr:hypothetical protein [Deltaproteobacteria bacterium]
MSTLRIKAKEFVRDVKSAMDDYGLMLKYGLTPEQLQAVFRQLIDMDLLSQDQIDVRSQLSETCITRAFLEVHKHSEQLP